MSLSALTSYLGGGAYGGVGGHPIGFGYPPPPAPAPTQTAESGFRFPLTPSVPPPYPQMPPAPPNIYGQPPGQSPGEARPDPSLSPQFPSWVQPYMDSASNPSPDANHIYGVDLPPLPKPESPAIDLETGAPKPPSEGTSGLPTLLPAQHGFGGRGRPVGLTAEDRGATEQSTRAGQSQFRRNMSNAELFDQAADNLQRSATHDRGFFDSPSAASGVVDMAASMALPIPGAGYAANKLIASVAKDDLELDMVELEKRGYSKEEIIHAIQNRETDYTKSFVHDRPLADRGNWIDRNIRQPINEIWENLFGEEKVPAKPKAPTRPPIPRPGSTGSQTPRPSSSRRSSGQEDPALHGGSRYTPSPRRKSNWESQTDRSPSSNPDHDPSPRNTGFGGRSGGYGGGRRSSGSRPFESQTDRSYGGSRGNDYDRASDHHGGRTQL